MQHVLQILTVHLSFAFLDSTCLPGLPHIFAAQYDKVRVYWGLVKQCACLITTLMALLLTSHDRFFLR